MPVNQPSLGGTVVPFAVVQKERARKRRSRESAEFHDSGLRRERILDAWVAKARRMPQPDDARIELAAVQVEDANGAKTRRPEVRMRGAARVDLQHAIAIVQALEVRVPSHDDVGSLVFEVVLAQVVDGPVLRL